LLGCKITVPNTCRFLRHGEDERSKRTRSICMRFWKRMLIETSCSLTTGVNALRENMEESLPCWIVVEGSAEPQNKILKETCGRSDYFHDSGSIRGYESNPGNDLEGGLSQSSFSIRLFLDSISFVSASPATLNCSSVLVSSLCLR
jgi:hypothetical protein